jgi:hypothetical protein
VIAAGDARGPERVALRAGAEVRGVEFVETTAGEVEATGRFRRIEFLDAEAGQDVPDQGRGQTVRELLVFFIGGG